MIKNINKKLSIFYSWIPLEKKDIQKHLNFEIHANCLYDVLANKYNYLILYYFKGTDNI